MSAPTQRASPAETGGEAMLARVIQRMNASGGFPALDHSVGQIIEALELGAEDTTPLINAVLADVSLTQKVLRLANSAMYAPIGKSVATVSHAMMVLGFDAVGHLALGAKVIGTMGQLDSSTGSARRVLAHSLLAGSVAGNVATRLPVKHGEMGIVCSLLHRIGRLLAAFYLPQEWQRIQRAVASGCDEQEAAHAVLGMSLDQLGTAVAQLWRLPNTITLTMSGQLDEARQGVADWLLALTCYADGSAGLIGGARDEEAKIQLQQQLVMRFAPRLGLAQSDLLEATRAATTGAAAEPILASMLLDAPLKPAKPAAPSTSLSPSTPLSTSTPLLRLREDEQEIRQARDEGGTPAEIMNMVLEAIYRALDLSRAAVFLLDQAEQVYRVQASLSARESNPLGGVRIPVAFAPDLAHIALAKNVDVYIDNPRDAEIAAHLPAWIRAHALHPFFLLPMSASSGNPLGLIFGQQNDDQKLNKQVLLQLATLRNLLQARLTGKPA